MKNQPKTYPETYPASRSLWERFGSLWEPLGEALVY